MIKKEYNKQNEIEMVTIEELVPTDHILRKIDRHFDFSFVHERMDHLYCHNNGRPAIDPVVLFKMLFIGYMFGIRSERQLVKEIEVNVAYRWFLNLNLSEKVPHHSTISQNRIRRFNGTDVFRQMFDDVVEQAFSKGYIEGKTLYTDSTHLKANANKNKFNREAVSQSTKSYLDELDKAVSEDREKHNKKQLPVTESSEPKTKDIRVSKTDPESGYLCREGKPEGFFYLDHRTTDGKFNLITDVHVTPGNVHDSTVYVNRLDYQIDKFGFQVDAVGLDAGYNTPHICHSLITRDIFGVIGYKKPTGIKDLVRKGHFLYDSESDFYTCPEGHRLKYRGTNRSGHKEYISDRQMCSVCPLFKECIKNKAGTKIVMRHVWEDSVSRIDSNRKSEKGKYIKRRRAETVERSFADAKQLHSYRYARFRGLEKVETQSLMTAIVQNIKKIVTITENYGKTGGDGNNDHQKQPMSDIFQIIRTIKHSFSQCVIALSKIRPHLSFC